MADQLSVFLSILLDKVAQKDLDTGFKSTEETLDSFEQKAVGTSKVVGQSWDALNKDFAKFQKHFDATFKATSKGLIDLRTGAKTSTLELIKFGKIDVNKPVRSMQNMVDATIDESEEVRILNKEIAEMAQLAKTTEETIELLPDALYETGRAALEVKHRFEEIRKETRIISRYSASIQRVSIGLGVLGAAMIAPIIASSKQYFDFIKEAGIETDVLTNRQLAASKRIQNAQINIGRITAETVLPLYEKGAELAEKAALFIQRNPDLVKATLATGVVVATLAAVGTAVARGIKLVADFRYIAATTEFALGVGIFQNSVRQFLGAQALGVGKGRGLGALVKGGGVLAGVSISAVAATVAAVLGGLGVGLAGYQAIAKATGRADLGQMATGGAMVLGDAMGRILGLDTKEIERKSLVFAAVIGKLTGTIDKNSVLWKKASEMAGVASDSTDDLTGSLRDYVGEAERAAKETKGMSILQDLLRENAEAEKRTAAERSRIIADAATQTDKANERFSRATSKIQNNLTTTLAKLADSFQRANAKAERAFQERRAKTISDGNEAVRRIQERAKEDLIRLEEDHDLALRDLVAARDALGLKREKERFAREKGDIKGGSTKEVAEARRQTQIRLAEQQRAFNLAQQERRNDFARRQAEESQAAALRIVELQEQHAQELQEIAKNRTLRLRELRLAANEERRARILAASQQIRDLGGALNAERELRRRFYSVMLGDTAAYLGAMASSFASLRASGVDSGSTGKVPRYQHGGPTGRGGLAILDPDEFVLDKSTTANAEKLIGQRLTQGNMLKAMSGSIVNVEFPGGFMTISSARDLLRDQGRQLGDELAKVLES